MSVAYRRRFEMAQRRKDPEVASRDRVNVRIDPHLLARIEQQAERHGLSVSAYLRMAAAAAVEADEATDPDLKKHP